MNIFDIIVVTLILFFMFLGMKKGLMHSILSTVYSFLSLALSFLLYPFVLNVIGNSAMFLGFQDAFPEEIGSKTVIAIGVIVFVFLILRILFVLVGQLLEPIVRFPIVKQVNGFGGLFFGFLQGVFVVYIAMFVLIFFSYNPDFTDLVQNVQNSKVASIFYNRNLILYFLMQI